MRLAAAIVDGRYEEDVRLSMEPDDEVLGKARGVFRLASGDYTIKYSYVPSLGNRGPWERLTYERY